VTPSRSSSAASPTSASGRTPTKARDGSRSVTRVRAASALRRRRLPRPVAAAGRTWAPGADRRGLRVPLPGRWSLMTNAHVVADADVVTVRLPRRARVPQRQGARLRRAHRHRRGQDPGDPASRP
jgi:hypothetical protein